SGRKYVSDTETSSEHQECLKSSMKKMIAKVELIHLNLSHHTSAKEDLLIKPDVPVKEQDVPVKEQLLDT
ncbi:MAG: hypothetical protein IKD69_02115, partial [Solobacterium sp.]|nr:hypothetical protein [Solobacterium sp.]